MNGTTYQPAVCPAGACDPRGLGLNQQVAKVWNTIPIPNDPQFGDNYNTQGYLTNVSIPQTSDNYTTRIDHDFGDKWHLLTSYRYFKLNQNTTNQTDIGGLLGWCKGNRDRHGAARSETQLLGGWTYYNNHLNPDQRLPLQLSP